jgi:hypothetical protein
MGDVSRRSQGLFDCGNAADDVREDVGSGVEESSKK